MPVVFVHGVNTRLSAAYDQGVAARDALLRGVFLPELGTPVGTTLRSPYWGGHAATFAFDLACVPTGGEGAVQLGLDGDGDFASVLAAAASVAPDAAPDTLLLTVARRDFVTAVDLLVSASAQTSDDPAALADVAGPASAYALRFTDRPPGWVHEVSSDAGFVERLGEEATGPAGDAGPIVVLGAARDAWDFLRRGVSRVGLEAGAFVGKPAWGLVRSMIVPAVPRFVGDVFVYLEARGDPAAPGPIAATVLDALTAAAAERTGQDPLIVIGHSLGGVITYDLLSGFVPDLPVDLFCTVGSQVGLFEEMRLFRAGDARAKTAIRRWINVFDYNDVLSFKLAPIFAGVDDYAYPTGNLLHAHGAYFGQPAFLRRLAARGRTALAS